jgi:hypothetical protein
MSVIRSLLMLATVVSAILVPLFIGHALAVHESGPLVGALAFFGVACATGMAFLRMDRRSAASSGQPGPAR